MINGLFLFYCGYTTSNLIRLIYRIYQIKKYKGNIAEDNYQDLVERFCGNLGSSITSISFIIAWIIYHLFII